MAGGHDGPVKLDPAIERWNHMREAVYKHFRYTRSTTIISVLGLAVFPGLIYYTCTLTDLKWKYGGKRKGEPLAASS
ncbi:hypothetical protein PsYK624_170700 [Phanerochaete sordida]|uniref:NADH dehydrogenase [ubiquinone] 1 beta subcomplex subunit 4 n=1 Tax=Phanerochaete sordida TaxID=48140 RepID=A0A9P3LME9_9APHY|nr:hypothetical protein PsYK624_170700 [Phanerochaete sordida]